MERPMNTEELALLQEIALRATLNAAEAFSQFSGSKLTVYSVTLKAVPIGEIPSLSPPDEIVVGIKLMQQQDADGFLLAIIKEADAIALIEVLVGTAPADLMSLDEMELSALGETGNILTASFLTALETQCGLVVMPGTPSIAVDYGDAVLTDALLPLAAESSQVFVAQSDIVPIEGEPFCAPVQLLFSPSLPSWRRIFQAYKASSAQQPR